MRMMRTGAAAVLAAVIAGAVTAAPAPKTLRFNLNTVTDAQGMHVDVTAKVWVKGQKARLETKQPMTGPMVILVDGSTVRTLYPEQKRGTVATLQTGKNGPKNPWEFMIANVDQITKGAKKLGQQKLDGFTCDVYQNSRRVEGGTMTLKSWITRGTEPRLPIRVESKVQLKRPNMTVNQSQTTRITGIQRGISMPDSLFAVPVGYKIVQAGVPGAPGLPGGPGMRP